ncbi:conserved hypothetical protein, partial [Yersinia pestis biovar Orientalis str. IP275]
MPPPAKSRHCNIILTFTGHLALQHYLVRKVNGAIDFEF